MKILPGAPSLPNTYSLSNSYSKLIQILPAASLLPQHIFLMHLTHTIYTQEIVGAPLSTPTHEIYIYICTHVFAYIYIYIYIYICI
jgi:hypothetical protein